MNIKELKQIINGLPDDMQTFGIQFESSACANSVESAKLSETDIGPALMFKLSAW